MTIQARLNCRARPTANLSQGPQVPKNPSLARTHPGLIPNRSEARRLAALADAAFLRAMALHPMSEGKHNIAWDDHLGHWENLDALRAHVTERESQQ